jgi:hypothetical protein
MSSTVSALDRQVVGANLQELCNKVSDLTAAAIVDIEALQASTTAQAADGTYSCASGLAAGDWVYISAASTVAKADADDPTKLPVLGVITSKPTTITCVVRSHGEYTTSGLTAGATYYLSATAGAITSTAPSAPYAVPVGVAKSTTVLMVMPAGPLANVLQGTASTTGANVVGYDDSGSKTSAATVADALDELYIEGTSALGVIPLPPSTWYLLTGAPLAIFADGTTTVPGSDFDSTKCFCVRWNNDAAPAAITRSFQIPPDMDITSNPVIHGQVAKVGATNNAGNTTTLDIALYNQVDAALINADTDFGGTTSAVTPNATSLTQQNVTLTVTASNLAAYPAGITIALKPTAGTLNTDDLLFVNAYVVYKRKLRTS